MKQSLYGKYPGALKYDSKYVEDCSEMELFVVVSKYYEVVRMRNYCNKMINFAERNNDQEMKKHFEEMLVNEKKKNPLVTDNPQEYSYTLDYCLLQTARFNTNISYNPNGRVVVTDEFKDWYEKWQLYIATLDKNCYSLYARYRYECKSLSHFSEESNLIMNNGDLEQFENIDTEKNYTLQKNIRQISA